MPKKDIFIVLLLLGGLVFSSCKKDILLTNPSAKLSFSTDTLTFDTVFTTLGSTTLYFKVYNTHGEKINISDIRLGGGAQSHFRLNIDGYQQNQLSNEEIPAHDSVYVFVSVTVDPNDQNNPFVIYDSVMFETNGNTQRVILEAWGQNAHFYYGQTLDSSLTWANDKPYVIIHSILVDSNATLTIDPGCRIFMHADSYFIVQGGLIVNGQAHDSVIFRGDRLEQYYVDLPGNWGGILFLRGCKPSVITYAVVNEATSGIIEGSSTDTVFSHFTTMNACDVSLNETIIKNCLQWGIFSFLSNITAVNTLIWGCGENDLGLFYGGTHHFTDCTLADYSSIVINHQSAVLDLSDFAKVNSTYYTSAINANFQNTIVYGSLDNEFELDTVPGMAGQPITYSFDHCLLKTTRNTGSSYFISILKNLDPLFVDPYDKEDYHLQQGSPCIDAGVDNSIPNDLDDNPRPPGSIDMGCYEFQ